MLHHGRRCVDDDDTLQPAHERSLRDHVAKLPGLDAVIFRMSFWDATTDKLRPHAAVFPRLNATNFVINEVGISFAMKTSLCTQDEVDPAKTIASFRAGAKITSSSTGCA